MAKKRCSKCGEDFECKNEERGCWCEQLDIPLEQLEILRKAYDNCLCPRCLEAFSREKLKNS